MTKKSNSSAENPLHAALLAPMPIYRRTYEGAAVVEDTHMLLDGMEVSAQVGHLLPSAIRQLQSAARQIDTHIMANKDLLPGNRDILNKIKQRIMDSYSVLNEPSRIVSQFVDAVEQGQDITAKQKVMLERIPAILVCERNKLDAVDRQLADCLYRQGMGALDENHRVPAISTKEDSLMEATGFEDKKEGIDLAAQNLANACDALNTFIGHYRRAAQQSPKR